MKKGKAKVVQRWNETWRSCLCFVLVLVLALGNVTPVRATETEESTTNAVTDLVNVDFSETNWSGSEESGYTISEGVDTYETRENKIVKENGNENNTCLMVTLLNSDENPSSYFTYKGDVTGKKIVYEYKISFDGGESVASTRLRLARTGSTSDILQWRYEKIESKVDSSVTAKIEHGKWVSVAVVADYSTNLCDVYVDGTCFVQAASFSGTFLSIQFYKSAQNSHFLLDDMRIYEGTAPAPSAVELISDGTTTTYREGYDDAVTVCSSGSILEFASVEMDGNVVDPSNYTVTEGPTTVTFKRDYLDTLSAGTHNVTVNYTEGRSVESSFELIKETAATQQDIINLDFEGEWAEFASGILVDTPSTTVMQIADPENPANKCLKIYCPDTSTRVTVGNVAADGDVSGKTVVYDYKVSAISGEAISENTFLFVDYPNTTTYLRINSAGEIKLSSASDAEVFATVTAGKWTRVAMVVDYSAATDEQTGTYKLYVDGVCIKDDGVISNIDSNGENQGVQALMRMRLSKKVGHILIDDYRIYYGTEPLGLYESSDSTIELVESATTTSYERESAKFVTVKTTGLKTELASVQVDGSPLESTNYTLSDTAATTVTIANEYLDTLTVGSHTVTLVYSDERSVSSTLDITAVNYAIIADGTTTSYEKESGSAVTILSEGPRARLESVQVNGTALTAETDYTVEGDTTTTVKFVNTYLDSLAVGSYTVTLAFNDGNSVSSALEITPVSVAIIADGTTTSYEKGTDTGAITIQTAGALAELQSVSVNGILLTKDTDYTVAGDTTTTVTFTGAYVEELDAGKYTIKLVYRGDSEDSEERIAESSLEITFDPNDSTFFIPDIINLDFNGDWSEFGSYINKSSGETGTVFQVDDPTNTDESDLCLEMVCSGAKVNIMFPMNVGLDVTGKQIVYEYKISKLAGEDLTTKAKLFASTSNGGYVYMNGSGSIASSHGGTPVFGTVAEGTWIKLAMVVDYVNKTYRVYVDDVLQTEAAIESTTPAQEFMRVTLEQSGHILIDDLRVYEGTTPHVTGTATPVGTEVYVNRTFDEVYMYDFEEIEVTRKSGSVAVVAGTDNKYLKAAGTADSPATMTYITNADSNYIVAHAKLSLESADGNSGNIFTGVGSDGETVTFLTLDGASVKLPDGTVVATLAAGTWTDVAVVAAVNAGGQTYTVYVDGKAVAAAKDLEITEVTGLASIVTTITAGSLLIDDLRVYDAKKPRTIWKVNDTPDTIYMKDSTVQALIGDAVAIQLDVNTLFASGEKSAATAVFDTSEEGKVYLALADIQTLFGESVNVDGASVKNGCYDVIAVAEANGYTYVYEVEDRLMIFSEAELTLLTETQIQELPEEEKESARETNKKEINKYLQFERPSVEKIKELFSMSITHPRVLITPADVDRIKSLYNSDTYIKLWGDNAIAAAEEAVTTPEFSYRITGSSMDDVAEALPMIINLGMAYFLTDDEGAKASYVTKAKNMAMTICNLEHWNPGSYLDVGELSFILGIAYDWFYDEYTEDERAIIEENLMEKGVGIQNKIYYGQASSEVYWTWWDNTNNWNAICNGGTMLGAIALYDKYPDICAQVIANSMHGLEFMMESYYPEGVWHEGGGYWRYSLNYVAYTMMTFGNVFGDDFNFLISPGLDQTGWYGLKLSGSTGINNFGDAGTDFVNNPSVLWCATQFRDAELMAARLQEMELQGYTGDGRDMIFYDEDLLGDTEADLPLDTVLDSMSVVSLRERWYDIGATFLGFSGTKTKSGHAHMDIGAFVVDMLGQRIIGDVGANDYNAVGYFDTSRYYYYRARPEGHNIYIINPTGDKDDYGGYTPWVEATNTPVVSKDRGAYSTLDLSNVYAEDTNSAIRGYMLTDDRRSVLVRDEIDLKGGSEIYSFLHTKATVEFDENDSDVAILTLNGTKYKVVIDVQGDAIESYSFQAVAAESMGDYGVSDSSNAGWCKLQIYVKTSAAGAVNITMKIVGYDDPAADKALITTPIAEWSADMIDDGEAPVLPTVDMIYVDGEPVKDFDPNVTGYTGRMAYTATLPVVTAASNTYERIDITQADDFGEDYIVTVYDNVDESLYRVYRLNYTKLPALKPVDGRVRYAVASMTASASPEAETKGFTPESTIDNDFSESRWTSQCLYEGESHWLMMELDEVSVVHKIGLAFYKGDARNYIFKLEVSVDGESWTEVYDGQELSETTELEYFYENETGIEAKFVRFTGSGSSYNGWNNVTEFVVLGPENVTDSYELGSNETVEILHNGTTANLKSVTLGEEVVDPANYTAADGDIDTVTLKAEYLETLTPGTYELALNYENGSSIGITLTVEGAVELEVEVNNIASVSGAAITAPEGGWVEGENTFTVSAEQACAVLVSQDGGATYERLVATAVADAENSYSFTVDGVSAETIIAVAVAGDVNGDGKVTNADITKLRAAYAGKTTLDALQKIVVDVNASGTLTNADITKLRAAYAEKTEIDW